MSSTWNTASARLDVSTLTIVCSVKPLGAGIQIAARSARRGFFFIMTWVQAHCAAPTVLGRLSFGGAVVLMGR
jgi:hypothetical protein